ncbi:MAG: S24/S26 family peptidase [Eubacterium sp.]|nr:S24/S26 family peptidase [Eubacterium sp.]
MEKRAVDTNEYVTMLKEIIEEGHQVSMIISGNSMSPFLISRRDEVQLNPLRKPLKAGDIVFYTRPGGQYVLHRIHHIGKDGLYIIGDNQIEMEGPVPKEAVFAVVTAVKRKGIVYEPGDFWWWFFAHVWRHMIWYRKMKMKKRT